MSKTVLILGANGRFGTNAAQAYQAAGWTVRRFDRKTDTLETAARGASVIVNAWNMAYSEWATQVLAMQPDIHRVALANDATVIIPGNVYVFGAQTPAPWSHESARDAGNPLGRIRIDLEDSYRAAGVRTIVLRAGDFLDTTASGNWFDKIMAPGLSKGTFTYPGHPDIPHAFAYLPDVARAAVLLSDKRDALMRFEDVCFPGYTLTGAQMAVALERARGHSVTLKPLKWWTLRLIQPFWKEVRYLFEMRYLWDTPHSLSGQKFNALLPGFEHKPAEHALRQAAAHVAHPASAPQPSMA